MLRKPVHRVLSAEYEVYDDPEEESLVGHAIVEGGVIQKLFVNETLNETYKGQVLSTLMRSMIDEADLMRSNLSMRASRDTPDLRRFMERHGFRHEGGGIYKRLAGSIRPPSVIY